MLDNIVSDIEEQEIIYQAVNETGPQKYAYGNSSAKIYSRKNEIQTTSSSIKTSQFDSQILIMKNDSASFQNNLNFFGVDSSLFQLPARSSKVKPVHRIYPLQLIFQCLINRKTEKYL